MFNAILKVTYIPWAWKIVQATKINNLIINHLGSSLIDLLYSVTDVIHVKSINTILILINNTGNTK